MTNPKENSFINNDIVIAEDNKQHRNETGYNKRKINHKIVKRTEIVSSSDSSSADENEDTPQKKQKIVDQNIQKYDDSKLMTTTRTLIQMSSTLSYTLSNNENLMTNQTTSLLEDQILDDALQSKNSNNNNKLHCVTPRVSTVNLYKLTNNTTENQQVEDALFQRVVEEKLKIIKQSQIEDVESDSDKEVVDSSENAKLISPSNINDDTSGMIKDEKLVTSVSCPEEKVEITIDLHSMPERKIKKKKLSTFRIMVTGIFYIIFSYLISMKLNPNNNLSLKINSLYPTVNIKKGSIHVAGGGFSGFWYTLGRLQSINDPINDKNDYYCYSAGCLAVIVSLSNISMEHIRETAFNIQNQWQNNIINRYDIVEIFINELFSCSNNNNGKNNNTVCEMIDDKLIHPFENKSILRKVNVITTQVKGPYWWSILQPVIRKANNINDLKHMLLQTTWIPFATGNQLSLNGHLDGAISSYLHPVCEYHLGLTTDIELMKNVININLGREEVESLWNKGLIHGL